MASSNAAVQALLAKDLVIYKGVSVEVDDCVASVHGAVNGYHEKVLVERRVRKNRDLTGVSMNVTVGGPAVEDVTLAAQLEWTLRRDRRTRGELFEYFAVGVNHGTVTIIGMARSPMVRDDTLELVASGKGVKGIVDNIRVNVTDATMPEQSQTSQYSAFKTLYVDPLIARPQP